MRITRVVRAAMPLEEFAEKNQLELVIEKGQSSMYEKDKVSYGAFRAFFKDTWVVLGEERVEEVFGEGGSELDAVRMLGEKLWDQTLAIPDPGGGGTTTVRVPYLLVSHRTLG